MKDTGYCPDCRKDVEQEVTFFSDCCSVKCSECGRYEMQTPEYEDDDDDD